MDLLQDVLVTLTVVTTGLSAGVLAGFGYSVIPGLTRAGADVAVPAMHRMNSAILNPLFAVIFGGGVVFGALSTWATWNDGLRWWVLAATLLTLGGVAITMAINVPANNRLDAAADSRGDEAAQVWAEFTAVWVPWNIVRSVLTTAAVVVLVVGLLVA
ncbi:anthrone oxygenase family protein [Gordonia metallireducens]|uniref:anthrone oxygenase family protein n=1 Tax=Gordonia metallireducens TaxID=2897779 RepID=UPI001E63B706|nr:anthrone oxygenase family protein [Gordonia metallireducens]